MDTTPQHGDSAETLLRRLITIFAEQEFVTPVASYADLPNPGKAGVIYIAVDTSIIYRWTGIGYDILGKTQDVASIANLPPTGVAGVIYITLDTNVPYRWTGSTYAPLSPVQTVDGQTGNVLVEHLYQTTLNKTGVTISKGKVVIVSGAQGQRPTIALADPSSVTAHSTIGVVVADIDHNDEGLVMVEGVLGGINLGAFSDGQLVYLTTAGGITGTAPSHPNHVVQVGTVVNAAGGSAGKLYVRIVVSDDLANLHDVVVTGPVAGQSLVWDGSKWVNWTFGSGGIGTDIQDVWASISQI